MTAMANEIEFWPEDRQFGLRMTEKQLKEILRLCKQACPLETGGILIGHYTDSNDCAVVTEITNAPPDSRSGNQWFVRGVRGLQKKLDRLWQRGNGFYLGEWHFHPFGSPSPSHTDGKQMQEISKTEKYHCPEPVLLILGGDPESNWTAQAYAFPRGRKFLAMRNSNTDNA